MFKVGRYGTSVGALTDLVPSARPVGSLGKLSDTGLPVWDWPIRLLHADFLFLSCSGNRDSLRFLVDARRWRINHGPLRSLWHALNGDLVDLVSSLEKCPRSALARFDTLPAQLLHAVHA